MTSHNSMLLDYSHAPHLPTEIESIQNSAPIKLYVDLSLIAFNHFYQAM